MFSVCMCTPFVPVGCLLSRLVGYHDHVSVFVPGLLGGFGILAEQPHKRGFLACSFAAMVLEYVLRQLEECGVFRVSRSLAALLFMASNGLLMYLLRREQSFPRAGTSKNMWLFYPPPVRRKNTAKQEKLSGEKDSVKSVPHVCPHEGSCLNHVLMGAGKYALMGVGLQLVRKGLPRLRGPASLPAVLLGSLRDRHSTRLGMFLGAYVGIYSAVSCALNQLTGRDSELHAVSAGVLAGLAYWIQPNLAFALTGFTTALMMLARHLAQQETVPSVPGLLAVLFAACFGILLHARAFEDHLCPRLATSITSATTNGRCDHIAGMFQRRRDAFIKNLKFVT
ncbi:transmembrane protein 135-like isoform X2 [Bacillus rossius redtenbacheri]